MRSCFSKGLYFFVHGIALTFRDPCCDSTQGSPFCLLGTYHYRVCTSRIVAPGYRRVSGEEGHLHYEVVEWNLQTKAESIPLRAKPKTKALLLHITNLNSTPQTPYDLWRLGLSAINLPAEDYVRKNLHCQARHQGEVGTPIAHADGRD